MKRPSRKANPGELRKIFNDGRYLERALLNQLLVSTESSKPAPPSSGQPPGTMTEMVWYFDLQAERIALVHQYRLPDGTLGGSGLPDPKRILLDDQILYC
jgi:hypothetical protein